MTSTQLRAFSAVVRLGSVKEAASELGVTEAAVSLHIGHLRKELEDRLFTRTAAGLAFTPGGLRLASRATELLGLELRTIREVSQAGQGKRLLRLAASSLFAEHAAPGLIDLFAGRADDLDVEMSVRYPREFAALLASRTVDVAIGPKPETAIADATQKPFLNYQIVVVAGPAHPLAGVTVRPAQLREQTWLLGPSAAGDDGVVRGFLRRF
ncbi:MAG: LysR family transcriptional regulator, partial [Acidimicrobiales bacterium]